MTDSQFVMREYALSLLGRPYIWGGDDPMRGFDCSGLVQEILASVGFDPQGDQNAQALYKHFLPISQSGTRGMGALVFYGSSVSKINHVAMLLDTTHIIEAGGGGSTTVSEKEAIAQNAFVRIRPYNRRKDIVAILLPGYP